MAEVAHAATWIFAGDRNWTSNPKWSTGNEPGIGAAVLIDNGYRVNVTLAGEEARNVVIGHPSGTSGSLRIFAAGNLRVADWVLVGRTGTGTGLQSDGVLRVQRPTNPDAMVIAFSPGSSGTYTISGGVLRVTAATGDLVVGREGTGILNVSGTALLTLSDDMYVGGSENPGDQAGTGTVSQNGGAVGVTDQLVIGGDTGSTGSYNASDGTLTTAQLIVGPNGAGTFKLTGSDATVTVSPAGYAQNGTSALRFVVGASGVSPIDVTGPVDVDGILGLDFAALDQVVGDIVLINNDGSDAITGVFNNANRAEGDTVVTFTNGDTYSLTYQYEAGGDGEANDIALLAPRRTVIRIR
ncbi:MAG: T5SS/PEP-CTERM-associated repeat protein [Rhodothermales bacterium]|jgi:T5SS/PEP-CTERM-associated repeat protein